MFYNIFLTSLPSADHIDKLNRAKVFFASVACENADMVTAELLPVNVCRYATSIEVDFYLAKAAEYGCTIDARPIQKEEDVFQRFVDEIGVREQLDIRNMSQNEIHKSLNDGVNALCKYNAEHDSFVEMSNTISEHIRECTVGPTLALFKTPSLICGLLSAIVAVVYSILGHRFEIDAFRPATILTACIAVACVALLVPLAVDIAIGITRFSRARKKQDEKLRNITVSLLALNSKKNRHFHEVEKMVDSMVHQNLLLVLRPQNRRFDYANAILQDISNGASLKQILDQL